MLSIFKKNRKNNRKYDFFGFQKLKKDTFPCISNYTLILKAKKYTVANIIIISSWRRVHFKYCPGTLDFKNSFRKLMVQDQRLQKAIQTLNLTLRTTWCVGYSRYIPKVDFSLPSSIVWIPSLTQMAHNSLQPSEWSLLQ